MQNVSNLVIPEGEVNAIHDKNGNLLWGRLAYNTKYAGDTEQDGTPTPDAPVAIQVVTGEQTVNISDGVTSRDYVIDLTGKNLIDPTNLSYAYSSNPSRVTLNSLDSGFNITVSSGTTVQPFVLFKSVDLTSYVGSTIRMKGTFDAQGGDIRIGRMDADGGNRTGVIAGTTSGETISFTVPSDLGSSPYLFYGVRCASTSTQLVNNFTNLILTIDSPIDSYAPYYNYELCKIVYSDYQTRVDNLEKIGSSWYAHSLIYKTTLDGTEDWEAWSAQNQTNTYAVKLVSPSPTPANISGSTTYRGIMSDKFSWYRQGIVYTTDAEAITTAGGNIYIRINKNRLSSVDVAGVKAWLHDNSPVVYYLLATPTDTQITDTTLISQLDSVHEWLTRYGYTSTVTGSLPIVIDKTNL